MLWNFWPLWHMPKMKMLDWLEICFIDFLNNVINKIIIYHYIWIIYFVLGWKHSRSNLLRFTCNLVSTSFSVKIVCNLWLPRTPVHRLLTPVTVYIFVKIYLKKSTIKYTLFDYLGYLRVWKKKNTLFGKEKILF